jgi:phosphonate transport system substrate-binding protein
VAPVISPEKSLVLYRQLVDYLATKLDRTPVFLQEERYDEANHRVRDSQCDLAFVCTYAYVLGERDFGMQALVAPQIAGAVTYHSVILVSAGSPARGLLDLRGKRFGSADRLSNTGWLYPATWLREQGCDPTAFFAEHVITGSHDRSVRAVVGGFVDGAAVDSLVYDQMVREEPALGRRTVVIHKSPPFGMPPLVVPAQCDPELRERLRELLVQMDGDARGREILRTLGIERFVVPERALYDSVRTAVAALEASP